jgi:uncharacterized iron-regulated membrane protein
VEEVMVEYASILGAAFTLLVIILVIAAIGVGAMAGVQWLRRRHCVRDIARMAARVRRQHPEWYR